MEASVAAAELKRTADAVRGHRRMLGMPNFRSNLWTEAQTRFVKDNPDMPANDVAKKLGKTLYAAQSKRRELGLSRKTKHIPWSTADDARVAEWTPKMRAKDIAGRMGRTTASVHIRQRHLGLSKTCSELSWTDDQVTFMKDNPYMRATTMAAQMGKTPGAVRSKRRKLGMPNLQEKKPWTEEELDVVRSNKHLKLAELYKLFPYRSKASVCWAATNVGRPRKNLKGMTFANGYKHVYPGGERTLEHRLLAAEKIGRPLDRNEQVHHIDHDKTNNDLGNLDVLPNQSAHMKVEASISKVVPRLMKSGALAYDRDTHAYFIPKNDRAF